MLRKISLALITLSLVPQVFGMNVQVGQTSRCARAKQGAKRLFWRYAPGLVSAMSLGYAIGTCEDLSRKEVPTQEDIVKAYASLGINIAGFVLVAATTLKPKIVSMKTAVADTGIAVLSAASAGVYFFDDIKNRTLSSGLWGATKGSVGSLATNTLQLALSVHGLHQACKDSAAQRIPVVAFPLDTVLSEQSTEEYQMLTAECCDPVSAEGNIQ